MRSQQHLLSRAPQELTSGRLRRLGEGLGKVVYASEHWVVKRERTAADIIALIVIWGVLRRLARLLPSRLGAPLLRHPSRWIRVVRVMVRPLVHAIPRRVWLATHAGHMWQVYESRNVRGERLARARLTGTRLMPDRVSFPRVRLRVAGWPFWLAVSEASERVEGTLRSRLADLAAQGRFDEMEVWLNRFLELRQAAWQHGVFSVDAHLNNYGVAGDRVVLLDSGGLTDHWPEVDRRLAAQADEEAPHVRLGLGRLLAGRPDIAGRFDARWREIVSRSGVLRHWPGEPAP